MKYQFASALLCISCMLSIVVCFDSSCKRSLCRNWQNQSDFYIAFSVVCESRGLIFPDGFLTEKCLALLERILGRRFAFAAMDPRSIVLSLLQLKCSRQKHKFCSHLI